MKTQSPDNKLDPPGPADSFKQTLRRVWELDKFVGSGEDFTHHLDSQVENRSRIDDDDEMSA